MKTNRKPTPRYTGICHTDSRSIAEAYGSNKDTVTRKTLAGALCFNETTFSILTTQPGKPVTVEHYTITDHATATYTLTATINY